MISDIPDKISSIITIFLTVVSFMNLLHCIPANIPISAITIRIMAVRIADIVKSPNTAYVIRRIVFSTANTILTLPLNSVIVSVIRVTHTPSMAPTPKSPQSIPPTIPMISIVIFDGLDVLC